MSKICARVITIYFAYNPKKEVKIEEALCTLHSSLQEIFPFNHHFFSCFRETVIKTNKMMIKSCCWWWWWQWLQYFWPGTDKTGSHLRHSTCSIHTDLISAHITYICEDGMMRASKKTDDDHHQIILVCITQCLLITHRNESNDDDYS